MNEEELESEAARLLDAFGEWLGGKAWWAAAGRAAPPRELVEAVKLEMIHQWAANPPPPGAAYLHFNPRAE